MRRRERSKVGNGMGNHSAGKTVNPGGVGSVRIAVDKFGLSFTIQKCTGRSSVWLERTVRDREVGSSNLLAPTWNNNSSSLAFSGELFLVWHQGLAVDCQFRHSGPNGQPSSARWGLSQR